MVDILVALVIAAICGVAAAIPVWSHRVQREFYLAFRRTFAAGRA